jgi:hypothetical protein
MCEREDSESARERCVLDGASREAINALKEHKDAFEKQRPHTSSQQVLFFLKWKEQLMFHFRYRPSYPLKEWQCVISFQGKKKKKKCSPSGQFSTDKSRKEKKKSVP